MFREPFLEHALNGKQFPLSFAPSILLRRGVKYAGAMD